MNKAIIFIDVQKDFIDGALRNEKAIEVTPKIVDFAKNVVTGVGADIKLYATLDTHDKTIYDNTSTPKAAYNPEIPISGYMTSLEGQNIPIEHCIEGSEGWELDDDLWNVIKGKCTVIPKTTFGSFDLAEILEEDQCGYDWHDESNNTGLHFRGKKRVKFDEIILVGFVTDICVAANAILLRAKFPNTKITVIKDLCVGTTEENHEAVLKVLTMQQINVV